MQDHSIETKSTSCRTKINKAIRTALSSPSPVLIPDINKNTALFDDIPDELSEFVKRFQETGSKFVPFFLDKTRMRENDRTYIANKLSEVYGYVRTEIDQGGYHTVLNASPRLTHVLNDFNIHCVDSIPADSPADAVIVYAEYLLPRSGSFVFSQRNKLLLYPSIRNLARNIIVLAGNVFVHDLKDLLSQLTQVAESEEHSAEDVDLQFDLMEIFRPDKVENDEFSPLHPHVTLVMIIEQ